MIGSGIGSVGTPQQRSHDVFRYPAPIQGMDIRQAIGSGGDLRHCMYTYNLMPFEFGMRVRRGYREWQVGVEPSPFAGAGVHTLIPFDSVQDGGVGDKLFAVTNIGIYDVTNYNEAPIEMVVFPIQDVDAGYGTFTHYVNEAENDVLFYADNINGLWEYNALTELWAVPTGITGIDVAEVKFVMSHKNNVWFALQNSTVGYYLPILSNSGQVSAQFFGDKFKHGGTLEGLFSWTIDGGDGVDDILVAVSHGGDVILYVGSGPDADDWGMKGIYFIGEIPNTPRFGSEQGGELYLLSAYGIVSMNDLLQGVDSAALKSDVAGGNSLAIKIGGLVREKMKSTISSRGWDIALVPTEGGFLLSSPTIGSEAPIQYYYNLATQGWGIWRDVPMQCFTEFENSIFFGTGDGRIMKMDVSVDNALLNPPIPSLNGDDINFSILSSYSGVGSDGIYKGVKLIRPDFISPLPPSHSSQARYDFDVSEATNFELREPLLVTTGLWDVSDWDNAVWGSNIGQTFPTIGGAWGRGRYVAIATRGASRSETRLIGWDVVYQAGGPMI
jgi:hypothetical protein